MSKGFVVSANYRDRSSAYRWLVRRADEPAEKAVACKSVKMEGVEFVQLDDTAEEMGFGCRVVAQCDTVVMGETEPLKVQPVSLHFALNRFYNTENNRVVTEAKSVELGADGSVMAIL